MSEHWLIEDTRKHFPGRVNDSYLAHGSAWLVVSREKLKDLASFLRNDRDFNFLVDLTCVDYRDWEEKKLRYELVYNLLSLSRNERAFIKVGVPEEDPSVDSVAALWPAANWYEREVWDMFGVKFAGHPNLKRILMYDGFLGHPLRKDYPYNLRQPMIGPKN